LAVDRIPKRNMTDPLYFGGTVTARYLPIKPRTRE
jgi:hypothetical protein